MVRTDTTLDIRTKGLKACRVIVANKCEFLHSSSRADCNFDARRVSKTRKYRSTKKLREHVCNNNSKRPSLINCISTNAECRSDHRWLVYKHSLVLIPQVSALSVIARSWALKFSPTSASVSVHKISRCIFPLSCTLLLLCFLQMLS